MSLGIYKRAQKTADLASRIRNNIIDRTSRMQLIKWDDKSDNFIIAETEKKVKAESIGNPVIFPNFVPRESNLNYYEQLIKNFESAYDSAKEQGANAYSRGYSLSDEAFQFYKI